MGRVLSPVLDGGGGGVGVANADGPEALDREGAHHLRCPYSCPSGVLSLAPLGSATDSSSETNGSFISIRWSKVADQMGDYGDMDELYGGLTVNFEIDLLPIPKDLVTWLKVEL